MKRKLSLLRWLGRFALRQLRFWFLVLAALALLLLGLRQSGQVERFQEKSQAAYGLSLVVEGQHFFAQLLKQELGRLPQIDQVFIESEAEARKAMESDERLVILFLPDQAVQAILAGELSEPLKLVLHPRMPEAALQALEMLESFAESLRQIQGSNLAYQAVYYEGTGDWEQSWKEASRYAMRSLALLHVLRGRVEVQEAKPLAGPSYYLAGVFLFLLALPSLIFLERLHALEQGPLLQGLLRQRRLGQAQAALWLLSNGLRCCLLLILGTAFLPKGLPQKGSFVLLGFLLACSFDAWALLLGGGRQSLGSKLGTWWAGLLLSFFVSGVMYPSSLFIGRLEGLARHAPLRASFELLWQGLWGVPFTEMAALKAAGPFLGLSLLVLLGVMTLRRARRWQCAS